MFQVTKQQSGRDRLCEGRCHTTTNSLSVKDLQMIPDPNCKMIAHWIWCGIIARRQIMGYDVWTAWPLNKPRLQSSNCLLCSVFIQIVSVSQFWENVLTTTWWFPGVPQQTAKNQGSIEYTPASQTGVLLPLWSHYRTLWHNFQQTLQEECPLLVKGPLTPNL